MSAGYTRSMCRLICRTFQKLEPDEVEMISALRDHRYEPYGRPSSRAQSSGIPRDSDGRPLPDARSSVALHIVIGPAGDAAVLPPPEPDSVPVDEETLPRNLPEDLRRLRNRCGVQAGGVGGVRSGEATYEHGTLSDAHHHRSPQATEGAPDHHPHVPMVAMPSLPRIRPPFPEGSGFWTLRRAPCHLRHGRFLLDTSFRTCSLPQHPAG